MKSLFDYLGRAAGPELGKQVYQAAQKLGIPVETRYIATHTYTGNVMLYPEEFLNLYFK
jgi:hypothetical protein